MRKIYNCFLTAVLFLTVTTAFAQGVITGKVVDGDLGEPLPGANVMVKGSSTGTTTDFDGNFTINVDSNTGVLTFSYLGFVSKDVRFTLSGGSLDLGTITLNSNAEELEGVVVVGSGVIDLANDRQTPIAVSSVSVTEIQTKAVGNVEFPEVLKNTPNVYVSNQSGGFGDSQMFVRGFGQNNTAFLLNGQPINGMEDGNMYWSNWSGMSDVANGVQIQRGLGSSKLAISSVGGTVNIVTRATDKTEGGFARVMVGNGSYFKTTASYNTGMSDSGWGFSFLLDYWQAHSKYANGTKGQGQNYFFSVGKKAGDHNFNFLITGAPQWHDQNFSKSQELYDKYGIRFNNNYGFKNGEYLSLRRNFYHKPVLNLNWDWNISEKSSFSTVVYASFGRGGGTGDYGNGVSYVDNGDPDTRGAYLSSNGLIDWNYIVNTYNPSVANNLSQGYNGTILRASVNNHAWYGTVFNYSYDTLKNFTFNVGADFRFYAGDHFREITDLLGLDGRVEPIAGRPDDYVVSATFNPDPWAALFNYADEDERIDYDYSENINYQGAFGQVEYANNGFTAFVQGAISNQSYKREDRGNFATPKESSTKNISGYNIKGGVSWNFIEGNTVYVNSGKYSRQPFLDNIFPSYDDNTMYADPEVDNEEIFGFEAGYRFEAGDFVANLNGYITKWDNRYLYTTGEYTLPGGEFIDDAGFSFTNIGQLHKGIEIDGKWRPTYGFMLRGQFTIGDWKYDGSSPVNVRNNTNNEQVASYNVDLTGTYVGQAPQTSYGLGTSYQIIPDVLTVDADWNGYANLYGFVDVEDVVASSEAGETYQAEKLDAYSLFDLGATYKFNFGDNNIVLRGNAYNLFDKEYINQKDNYGYFYGNGLTWNFSVRYNF
ncbi:TonB-dependent receptor [Robertkochia solimangrovi]|uniref:TonB-dependent receptor n=1 Tax=Robertkochia solimangrovi TaxID=2213046 RepID=UPI00117C4048|nr:TonB-dependent receptor [Robertkochia solimangrovi]TRZ45840.1 TonB-dependent receptor [Robertkochia solimangrovi]